MARGGSTRIYRSKNNTLQITLSVPLPLECIAALKIITLMEYFVFGAAVASRGKKKRGGGDLGKEIAQFTVEK